MIAYRPDIDGLRAIAVLSVVFYHADPTWISGGYVGVDVFFVISGFLITTLVLKDLDAGTFSLSDFWMRRIRRIFPALFAVMAVTLIVFSFFYPPRAFQDLGQSALAQTFFASNFLFWREAGYFDAAAESKPLLHTWSLAVEEQFYIVFPLLLLGLTIWLKKLRWQIVAFICALSFGLSIWGTLYYPSAAFYLLPFRAWELGIGCLLAFMLLYHRDRLNHKLTDEILSLIGLACIFASVLFFTVSTPFPSYTAALPCGGAALVIWANRNHLTRTGQLLSAKPVLYIGLISYSLYLWHWPVLVAIKGLSFHEPSLVMKTGALGAGFVLAALSYHFIETPIRRNKELFTNMRLAVAAPVLMLAIAGSGLLIHLEQGAANRFPQPVIQAYEAALSDNPRRPECLFSEARPFSIEDICLSAHSQPATKPDIVIWGDSHASALQPALEKAAKQAGINFAFAAYSSCPSISGLDLVSEPPAHKCMAFNQSLLDYVAQHDIRHVLLVSRFNVYAHGWDNYDTGPEPFVSADSNLTISTPQQSQAALKKALEDMVSDLAKSGTTITAVQQVPNFNFSPPDALFTGHVRNLPSGELHTTLSRPRAELDERSVFISSLFEKTQIRVLNTYDELCSESRSESHCYAFDEEGHSLYRDNDHLNNFGTTKLVPMLFEYFMRVKNDTPQTHQ